MDKKNSCVLKGFLIAIGVITTIVGTVAVLLKIFSKFFKISIEICSEDEEDDNCLCEDDSKNNIEVELPKEENDDDILDIKEDDEIEVEVIESKENKEEKTK